MNDTRTAVGTLRLIMLGRPGAGKGTQAKILEDRFGAVQISTGDILRRHRTDGTPLGKEAQAFMDAGKLVPDGLIISMMEEELRGKKNFILDGFPRTVAQAEALDALLARLSLPLTGVVLIEGDRETLVRRLSSRWTNPRTGRVYNEATNPPRVPGIDDEDGGPLVQRTDDTDGATAVKRQDEYEALTAQLVPYYTGRSTSAGASQAELLVRIDGRQPIDRVTDSILDELAGRGASA